MIGRQARKDLREIGVTDVVYLAARKTFEGMGWSLARVPYRGWRLFRVCGEVGACRTETCWMGLGTLAKAIANPEEWLAAQGPWTPVNATPERG